MEAVLVATGEATLNKSEDEGSKQVHSNGDANGAGNDGDSPPPAKKSKISASEEVATKAPILVELGSRSTPTNNGDEDADSDSAGVEENGQEHENGDGSDNESVCEVDMDNENSLNGGEDQGDGDQGVDEDEDDDDIQEVDEDGDLMRIDPLSSRKINTSNGGLEITAIKGTGNKSNAVALDLAPRRSIRTNEKPSKYADGEDDEGSDEEEESDIEEIEPQDPLALGSPYKKKSDPLGSLSDKIPKKNTIIVSDTKSLARIAASSKDGGKKEPTLVIIDTNSILSGKGPVPLTANSSLPAALPAQGLYPLQQKSKSATPPPGAASKQQQHQKPPTGLTDDMYVVEAPSFIVPYVYEKPAKEPLKETVDMLSELLKEKERKIREEGRKKKMEEKEKRAKKAEIRAKKKAEKEAKGEGEDVEDSDYSEEEVDDDSDSDLSDAKPPAVKPTSYFESPLGKFFMGIGVNLVQEFVQMDLLKMTKRKLNKGGSNSAENQTAVHSLLKNLEQSKENNKPYKFEVKQCKFCNFKTESDVALEHHLEIPHFKNCMYCCNFCPVTLRTNQDMLIHMQTEHKKSGRMERAPSFHQCPNCPFEDNQKSKITRHMISCAKRFRPEKNLEPPLDWEPPAKIPRVPKQRQMMPVNAMQYTSPRMQTQLAQHALLPKLPGTTLATSMMTSVRGKGRPAMGGRYLPDLKAMPKAIAPSQLRQAGMYNQKLVVPTPYQLPGNQIYQRWQQQQQQHGNASVLPAQLKNIMQGGSSVPLGLASGSLTIQTTTKSPTAKLLQQPSISITPLPRQSNTSSSSSPVVNQSAAKPGQQGGKNSFVICEICDGYIKDLEQLRNHMQWIHKVKIHPKMIYNRPPLNCQKCQFRFFTDQGLERHLLGSHGLVTSSMQEASNKGKDGGRCPVCGRVYQWKLLNHVAKDHNMTLKPAHLSYKCTVCTATFGMYKQFENHVYSAHSVVAKRVMDKKPARPTDSLLKPLKINDEITIIPQPAKSAAAGRGGGQKKVRCEVCNLLFPVSTYTEHFFLRHLRHCSVELCQVDSCSSCKNKNTGLKLDLTVPVKLQASNSQLFNLLSQGRGLECADRGLEKKNSVPAINHILRSGDFQISVVDPTQQADFYITPGVVYRKS